MPRIDARTLCLQNQESTDPCPSLEDPDEMAEADAGRQSPRWGSGALIGPASAEPRGWCHPRQQVSRSHGTPPGAPTHGLGCRR